MADEQPAHISVLLQESMECLAPEAGDTALDATVGAGGHARALCECIGESGVLVGIDADAEALETAQERIAECPGRVVLAHANFRELGAVLASEDIAEVDRVMFDLGLSSMQLAESGRGFSFQGDEPLDMRFGGGEEDAASITASDIINSWPEDTLAEIISVFGEERYAKKIARAIAEARTGTPIERTQQLVAIIQKAVPTSYARKRIHPATKTFQALRMATNEEVDALEDGLMQGYTYLTSGGRMAVISFHSIEDRIVKQFFAQKATQEGATHITKKPITPGEEEVAENPRARSAKLRVIQKQ